MDAGGLAAGDDVDSALKGIHQSWPGREQEASALWTTIARSRGCRCIFVHGRSGTGKTGLVRSVLAGLDKHCAYIDAVESSQERVVLQLIAEQLRGPKKRDAACASDTGLSLYDFMTETAALYPYLKQQTAWVVLDNVQRLPASLLRALLNLRHSSAAVSWVLISPAPLSGVLPLVYGQPPDLLHQLKVVHFRPYSPEECSKVMQQWQPLDDPEIRQQLQRQLVPLAMMSRNPEDMQQDFLEAYDFMSACSRPAVSQLQPAVAANLPGRDLSQGAVAARGPRRRHQRVPHGPQPNNIKLGAFATGLAPQTASNVHESRQSATEGLHLPVFGKVLIVAAYVASRTKEAMDRTNFDPSARRKRRRRALAHDEQTVEAHLDEVRGRNVFGRERLLAIFWSLLDAHLGHQEDMGGRTEFRSVSVQEQESTAILSHVASLVACKALLQVPENGLSGIKYACDMPDAIVRQLARDLKLDLSTYVH